MAFDGNGNWISDFSAVADRDANIKILASRFDNIFIADIAQSFENCLTKDMQVKPQQAFDANSYKIINVANPTNDGDAVNLYTLTSSNLSLSGDVSFGGNTTAVTPTSATDNSTKVATTEWVNNFLNDSSTKTKINGWGIPDYSNAVPVSINTNQNEDATYNVTANGYFLIKNGCSSGFNSAEISINGLSVALVNHTSTWVEKINSIYPVKNGDSVVYRNITDTNSKLYFVPMIGG